jgi:hypothetical protein
MRYAVIAGALVIWVATSALAQTMPPPFENIEQIVCVDQKTAVDLLAVYEQQMESGEALLPHLASRSLCERATFSGRPVTDVYASPTRKQHEGHVFEVDVTDGEVLKGRTKVYMLLYIMHDNEV